MSGGFVDLRLRRGGKTRRKFQLEIPIALLAWEVLLPQFSSIFEDIYVITHISIPKFVGLGQVNKLTTKDNNI